ncbi:MAG: alpha/beta hydrolase family protein, partial [Acidimicrobiales bacterium]
APGARPVGRDRSGALVAAVVAVAVAVVAASTIAVVLAVRHRAGSGPPSPPAATGTTQPPQTTTSTAPPVADGTYPVATTAVAAVDASIPGQGPRQLATTVFYPAASTAQGAPIAHGAPFPLLVFSEGFATAPLAYQVLLTAWASAGFVVAAPDYPGADPTTGPTDRGELVDEPTDLHAVVAAVAGADADAGSPLDGAVAMSAIGVVGQSDGGDVSLAVGAIVSYRVAGVGAMAVLSGAEYAPFGGQYFAGPTPPLLVVQGTDDPIYNPSTCSVQVYDAAPTPKYYLDLPGATHLAPYTTGSPIEKVVAQVTTDFFELTLDHRTSAAGAMATAGNAPGTATLAQGGTQPGTPQPCPTAP